MKRCIFLAVFLLYALCSYSTEWRWYDPMVLSKGDKSYIQNQYWNEDGGNYNRFPDRAQAQIRDAVWRLSQESAGLSIKFHTDASDIKVRYTVTGALNMPHMPTTGVSGVDLYRDSDKAFCFGSYSFGDTVRYEYHVDRPLHHGGTDYTLYLPLYNHVSSLEIGVPDSASFTFIPAIKEKPVVLYGTSIAQGACASRPGMAWGNILGRDLDIPVINLGFSGNGKLEPEVIELIGEIDASIFLIDCMPNLGWIEPKKLAEMISASVKALRAKHPMTPIVLIDHAGYSNASTNQTQYDVYTTCNKAQAMAYKSLCSSAVRGVWHITCEELDFDPDSWVDYVHPSDLGMSRQARVVADKIKKILNNSESSH